MSIISMPNNKKWYDNYDRIFKKVKDKIDPEAPRCLSGECLCTGPEPGQTMCPCALRIEQKRSQRWSAHREAEEQRARAEAQGLRTSGEEI